MCCAPRDVNEQQGKLVLSFGRAPVHVPEDEAGGEWEAAEEPPISPGSPRGLLGAVCCVELLVQAPAMLGAGQSVWRSPRSRRGWMWWQ